MREEQWPAVAALIGHTLANFCSVLEVMHGWGLSAFGGSPASEELLWRPEFVVSADFPELLRARAHLGFCLGRDDLWLTLPDGAELKFCHEGDLHLRVPNAALLAELTRALSELGLEPVRLKVATSGYGTN